jgi:hypothetical protein
VDGKEAFVLRSQQLRAPQTCILNKVTVIHLHRSAPAKPAVGAACNGCGVCCATEPCPVGMLWSRRMKGACTLLRWNAHGNRYRCALLSGVASTDAGLLRRLLARYLGRLIGAGVGCDSTLRIETR